MMEFEEMQKIWNEQKGETMYAINETELHRIVTRKKNATGRRINRVEIMLTIVNSVMAILLLVKASQGQQHYAYLSFGLMVITVVYVQYFRRKRKKAENMFDRTMMGELDQAISNSNFIIRFNYFVFTYLVVMAGITIFGMIIKGASLEKWLFITGMLLMSFFLVRWEQRACNFPRKKQLLTLKKKLTEEA